VLERPGTITQSESFGSSICGQKATRDGQKVTGENLDNLQYHPSMRVFEELKDTDFAEFNAGKKNKK